MATITSTANGYWDSGTTWVGGVAPGNGDYAIINHAVTVRNNTIVGPSHTQSANGAGVAVGAILVNGTNGAQSHNTGTNTLLATASGALTISSGITLTVRGNLFLNDAQLTITNGTSSSPTILLFDNSLATGSPCYGLDVFSEYGYTLGRVVCAGSATTGSYVNNFITGNVSGAWRFSSGEIAIGSLPYDSGILQLTGCTIQNAGTASTYRAYTCRLSGYPYGNAHDYNFNISYCRIDTCSGFDFSQYASGIGDLNWTINNTTFVNSISTMPATGSQIGNGVTETGWNIQLEHVVRIGTGHTRSLTYNVYDKPVIFLNISDITMTYNVYLDGWITQLSSIYLNITRQYEFTYYNQNYASGGEFWDTWYGSTYSNNIFVLDSPDDTNSHGFGVRNGIGGTSTSISYAYVLNNIFECQRLPTGTIAYNSNIGTATTVITTISSTSYNIHVNDIRSFIWAWGNGANTTTTTVNNQLPVQIGSNIYSCTGAVADTTNISTLSGSGGISGVIKLSTLVSIADGTSGNTAKRASYYGGNWIFHFPATSGTISQNVSVIKNNIIPPSYNTTSNGVGIYMPDGVCTQGCATASVNFSINYSYNTCLYPVAGIGSIDPNEVGGSGAGGWVAVQGNIWYRPTSAIGLNTGYAVWYRTDNTVYTDELTSSILNYNVQFNPNSANSYTGVSASVVAAGAGTTGTLVSTPGYYNVHVSSTVPPGLNDTFANPMFVDPDRSTVKFDLVNGGPGSALNVAQQMGKINDASGYNSAYAYMSVYNYIRSGYVAQNPIINGVGPGGTQPGAMGVSTPSAPSISSISSTPSSGVLPANASISVTLTLTNNVTITSGTPTLTLNDSDTLTYQAGSSTSTNLVFTGTIGSGNSASPLAITAFNFNGSSIQDIFGQSANFSGAITNLSISANGIPPILSGISATPTHVDGIGQVLTVYLAISEPVTVTGSPYLIISSLGNAIYSSSLSTSTSLAFTYTPISGQYASSIIVSSMSLNGGTILDSAGNALNYSTVNGTATGGAYVDAVAPVVTNVSATPSTGVANLGSTITYTIIMSKNIFVTGLPTLTLSDGQTANFVTSNSAILTFNHTVSTGESASSLTISSVNLNGGTILDSAGNASNFASAVGLPTASPVVDGIQPTISSIVASPTTGVQKIGNPVTFTITYTKPVVVTGSPTLTLNDGGTALMTSAVSNVLTFLHNIPSGSTTNGSNLTISSFNLPSGATIEDSDGNNAINSGALVSFSGLTVDGIIPIVSSISVSPSNGIKIIGNTLTFTLNMNKIVNISGGSPLLNLSTGQTATYVSGSGTNTLIFTHTIISGETTSGSNLSITSASANGATITDSAGNTASLAGAVFTFMGLSVDAIQATVLASVSPASGTLNSGQSATITLTYSRAVSLSTGSNITLTLSDGSICSMVSSTSNTMLFNHTVNSGTTYQAISISSLNLTGSLVDSVGNSAITTGAIGSLGIYEDGILPIISSVSVYPATGTWGIGKSIAITINWNRAVTYSGNSPSLLLNTSSLANYTSGNGTNSWVFTYIVANGDTATSLEATGWSGTGYVISDNVGNIYSTSSTIPNIGTSLTINGIASGGNSFLSGSTIPSSSLGNNGDTYVDLTNGEVYQKTSGNWVDTTYSLKGNSGDYIYVNNSNPDDNTFGNNGDIWLNGSSGELWTKIINIWTDSGYNLKGPQGSSGNTTNTASKALSTYSEVATTPTGNEIIPIIQNGTIHKSTLNDLKTLLGL